MNFRLLSLAAAAAVCLGACQQPQDSAAQPEPEKDPQVAAQPACSGQSACSGAQQQQAHGSDGVECSHKNDPMHAKDTVRQRQDSEGRTITVAGEDLSGAPEVPVSQVLAYPQEHKGKKVLLSGNVSTMCTHRRGWFAVVGDGDQSGGQLRVLTTPAFLVPQGSVGKTVRVEGTVDTIQLSPGMARHLAKKYQIETDGKEGEPVEQAVLRATGAEFL